MTPSITSISISDPDHSSVVNLLSSASHSRNKGKSQLTPLDASKITFTQNIIPGDIHEPVQRVNDREETVGHSNMVFRTLLKFIIAMH